jgi:hypothetical protein
MKMSRIRTLFLGVDVEKSDVDKELDPLQAPSLFDYDIVIADADVVLRELADSLPLEDTVDGHSADRVKLAFLNAKLHEEASLLVAKGGLLVCFLKPVRGFSYEIQGSLGREARYVTNYGWIPIRELSAHAPWRLSYGKGKRILLSETPSSFAPYLRMTNTYWVAYFHDLENLGIETQCLASNDAGLPIALEVPIEKGWLVFLPVSDHPKFSEIVLQCATRFLTQKRIRGRPPPDWVKSFVISGELERVKIIKSLHQQIDKLQAQFDGQEGELRELTAIKQLLYEGDEALENIVKKAFEELGFSLSKKDDIDWVGLSESGEAILEVTGSEDIIDIDKLRQLLNYLLNDYKETQVEKKAILVGNHFINDLPEKRGDPFTQKVLKEADTHSICLLTTVELFKAICEIREKKAKTEDIRRRIMETTGICKLV